MRFQCKGIKACWTHHCSLCMIHVFNMNHSHNIFCIYLWKKITAVWGLTTAFTQSLYNHTDLSMWLFPLSYISVVMKMNISSQNHPRIYCFISIRFNQTITLTDICHLTLERPGLPCIPRTLGGQHYWDHRRVFQLHVRGWFHGKAFLCIQLENCGSTQCTAALSNLL